MSQEDLGATILDKGPSATESSTEGPATMESTVVGAENAPRTKFYSPRFVAGDHAAPSARTGPPSSGRGLEPGQVLESRYRLEYLVGSGAMGEVWAAHHLGLDTKIAIKVIANKVEQKSAGLDRFYREARTMARLTHPNVVRVLDVSLPDAKLPFIAMELLEGESLRERMKRDPEFHLDIAREILGEVLGGLGVAHRNGIVHRDLKPANIFLVKDTRTILGFRVKVLDFGTAILLDSTEKRLTQEGIIIGTPYYMAPEQATGEMPTPSCDLYAAAVIFYELLSGQIPHEIDDFRALLTRRSSQEAAPIRSLVPKLPGPYDPFFSQALALESEDRFSSALAMRLALAKLPSEDGRIPSFDDTAFRAALGGALAGTINESDLATGATKVRPPPATASGAFLDPVFTASPQRYAGDFEAPELAELDNTSVNSDTSLSLDLENVEDGDLKRGLEAQQLELDKRQAGEEEAAEAAASATKSTGALIRHLISLISAAAAAAVVYAFSGGELNPDDVQPTPAILAALVGIAAFIGVSVAMTPVKLSATGPNDPASD